MKRILLLLPLTLAAVPGCLSAEALAWKRPATETMPKPPAAPPPTVKPEDVNEGNAAAVAAALSAEIAYDAVERQAQNAETPPKP